MVRLIVSEGGGLWRGFSFPRPAKLDELLQALLTTTFELEIYEGETWLNERRNLIPKTPSSAYTLTARTGLDPEAIVTLGFGGNSATLPVSMLRASTVEAALNSLAAMATAGGCDVRTLVNDPGEVVFRVTFRSTGSQSALTITAESGQVATVTEVTAGDGSTREVQTLKLEQKAVTTISTATSDVEATLGTPDTGVWTVKIDERATGGSWTLTVGGTATTPLDHDATAQQVLDAVATAAGDSNWKVTGDWRTGFMIRDDAGTPPTITLANVLQGWAGRTAEIGLSSLRTASNRSGYPIVAEITSADGSMIYKSETLAHH